MDNTNIIDLETELRTFTGTEDYYQHWLAGIFYTDGMKYLAEKANAYWLLDAIASHQMTPKVRMEEFQVWTLHCSNDLFSSRSAVLTCDDGNDNPPIVTQVIEFTDFPLDFIKLYLEFGSLDGIHTCQILMLPHER